jgi:hypothetical protein
VECCDQISQLLNKNTQKLFLLLKFIICFQHLIFILAQTIKVIINFIVTLHCKISHKTGNTKFDPLHYDTVRTYSIQIFQKINF